MGNHRYRLDDQELRSTLALCDELIALPAAGRRTALKQLSANNSRIHLEVESILQAVDASEHFLEQDCEEPTKRR